MGDGVGCEGVASDGRLWEALRPLRQLPCLVSKTALPLLPWLQTLALHLIEGVIDQVDGSVQVSWVQPRILTLPQVRVPRGGWQMPGMCCVLRHRMVHVQGFTPRHCPC